MVFSTPCVILLGEFMDQNFAKLIIDAVEDALRAGGKPPHIPVAGHERKAVAMAAESLGMHRSAVAKRLTEIRDAFNLEPDWSLYAVPVSPAQEPVEQREIVRLRDENARLKKQMTETHRAALDDEAIRDLLGGVLTRDATPPDWLINPPTGKGRGLEVPITIWSDWHAGEVVSAEETHGVNAFDKKIFEVRVKRLVERTIDLLRNHHSGNYPGIIVNLIGDLVSGGLHPELLANDEEEVIPSALNCTDVLVWCFDTLLSEFRRVYVPCAAGNHGRLTHKPEYKRYIYKNVDWLIYQLLARHYRKNKDIVFDIPATNEVHYRVFGRRYLAMHGDQLGVKGGDGIIGSIGPILRGAMKVGKQQAVIGRDFDTLLLGHWHTSLWLPGVIVNNTLKGWDEYAKNALRAPPSTPSQSLWLEHKKWGRTAHREVLLEDPPGAPTDSWVSVFGGRSNAA